MSSLRNKFFDIMEDAKEDYTDAFDNKHCFDGKHQDKKRHRDTIKQPSQQQQQHKSKHRDNVDMDRDTLYQPRDQQQQQQQQRSQRIQHKQPSRSEYNRGAASSSSQQQHRYNKHDTISSSTSDSEYDSDFDSEAEDAWKNSYFSRVMRQSGHYVPFDDRSTSTTDDSDISESDEHHNIKNKRHMQQSQHRQQQQSQAQQSQQRLPQSQSQQRQQKTKSRNSSSSGNDDIIKYSGHPSYQDELWSGGHVEVPQRIEQFCRRTLEPRQHDSVSRHIGYTTRMDTKNNKIDPYIDDTIKPSWAHARDDTTDNSDNEQQQQYQRRRNNLSQIPFEKRVMSSSPLLNFHGNSKVDEIDPTYHNYYRDQHPPLDDYRSSIRHLVKDLVLNKQRNRYHPYQSWEWKQLQKNDMVTDLQRHGTLPGQLHRQRLPKRYYNEHKATYQPMKYRPRHSLKHDGYGNIASTIDAIEDYEDGIRTQERLYDHMARRPIENAPHGYDREIASGYRSLREKLPHHTRPQRRSRHMMSQMDIHDHQYSQHIGRHYVPHSERRIMPSSKLQPPSSWTHSGSLAALSLLSKRYPYFNVFFNAYSNSPYGLTPNASMLEKNNNNNTSSSSSSSHTDSSSSSQHNRDHHIWDKHRINLQELYHFINTAKHYYKPHNMYNISKYGHRHLLAPNNIYHQSDIDISSHPQNSLLSWINYQNHHPEEIARDRMSSNDRIQYDNLSQDYCSTIPGSTNKKGTTDIPLQQQNQQQQNKSNVIPLTTKARTQRFPQSSKMNKKQQSLSQQQQQKQQQQPFFHGGKQLQTNIPVFTSTASNMPSTPRLFHQHEQTEMSFDGQDLPVDVVVPRSAINFYNHFYREQGQLPLSDPTIQKLHTSNTIDEEKDNHVVGTTRKPQQLCRSGGLQLGKASSQHKSKSTPQQQHALL